MSKSSKKNIGITMGDPFGIGPEILAKVIAQPRIRRLARFHIIGDYQVYRRYDATDAILSAGHFTDLKILSPKDWHPGKAAYSSGRAALGYLARAVELLKRGEISALVTAPVSKEAISLLEPDFVGHTEYLAKAFGTKRAGMMFVGGQTRVMIVTRHIPLQKVSQAIHPGVLEENIALAQDALKNLFRIHAPEIAVCGLNPHAGEGGKIGTEEKDTIIPVIKKVRRRGINVDGPFAADTLFLPHIVKRYDLILAMYHDQGLIPVKAMRFPNLVNLTVGLPFIRTSPAHGTAFDIAGRGCADPSSMEAAIRLAVELSGSWT